MIDLRAAARYEFLKEQMVDSDNNQQFSVCEWNEVCKCWIPVPLFVLDSTLDKEMEK